MSDCSAKEGEPKKFYGLNECADCEHYCSDCGTCCENVPDHQDCMMPCFVPSRAVMLAEVARDMHSALNYCSSGCSEGCPMLDDGCTVSSGELRSRLEALGVSVDDRADA